MLLSKKELEQTTLQENFWTQKESAYSTLQKIKQIEIKLDSLNKIDDDYDLLLFHIEIIKQQDDVSE